MTAEKLVIPIKEKTATGNAHSKLILVGEHAVVHGQPAIAIPFPLIGVESSVEEIDGDIYLESTLYSGKLKDAPESLFGVVNTIEHTLDMLGLPHKNLLIHVESTIPPGKGLGSSASVAIAIIKSLFTYADQPYNDQKLLYLANIAETHAHGSPSGIDPLTVNAKSPVWFKKEETIDYIEPNGEFYFVVADSGREADTKTAIDAVSELFKKAPDTIQATMDRLGDITHQVRDALEASSKQVLGYLLNEAQKELVSLGVSDTGLNKLIQLALDEGALGAKLTGGGHGGCIIALAKNELHSKQITERLKNSGAHEVWPFALSTGY